MYCWLIYTLTYTVKHWTGYTFLRILIKYLAGACHHLGDTRFQSKWKTSQNAFIYIYICSWTPTLVKTNLINKETKNCVGRQTWSPWWVSPLPAPSTWLKMKSFFFSGKHLQKRNRYVSFFQLKVIVNAKIFSKQKILSLILCGMYY